MSSEMLKGMITEGELLKLMNLKPSELAYLGQKKGFLTLNCQPVSVYIWKRI